MELLSPAGSFDKLKIAIDYGADAVYFGGGGFDLRAKAGNFSIDEIEKAMIYLRDRNKKGYLTVNSFLKEDNTNKIEEYLIATAPMVDAFIISDPGVFAIAKDVAPNVELHISTQANTTNSSAVNFWASIGASRVVMARELTKKELESALKRSKIELEVFIHGAICVSYSGRCLMSAYMTGRDANQGECTQPCRWNYTIKDESKPGREFNLEQNEHGTFLYNAKDMCMIDRIGELYDMGVASVKIEGRMKSVMYVGVVTSVYRAAIDYAKKNPSNYVADPKWRKILESVSNRRYTEGFYDEVSDSSAMNYETSSYERGADFLGVITGGRRDGNSISLSVTCRAKFSLNEELEIFSPNLNISNVKVVKIFERNNIEVSYTKPNASYVIECTYENDIKVDTLENSLLRRNV